MFKISSLMSRVACVGLLAAGSFAAFAQDAAQLPVTNPTGTVSLGELPAGVTGFTIKGLDGSNGTYTINRQFNGYTSLYRDDVLIRQIPASNQERVITGVPGGEGYEVTDNGDIMYFFYDSSSSPAAMNGTYKIVVPAGFCYTDKACTTTNPEWTFTVRCVGGDDTSTSADLTVYPTPDQTYGSLNTFTVTIPEGGMYRFNPELPAVTLEDIYGDADGGYYSTTAQINQNVCILTLTDAVTKSSTYQLSIPSGFVQQNTGSLEAPEWTACGAQTFAYYVKVLPTGIKFLPDPSVEYEYIPATVIDTTGPTGSMTKKYAVFTVEFDGEYRLLLNSVPKLYDTDDNGNPVGDPLVNFAIGRCYDEDGTLQKNKFYIVSQALYDEEQPYAGDLLLQPGVYSLVVPANTFYDTNGGNAEFQVNYTFKINDKFQMLLKPENGSAVKELQYITITYDEGTDVAANERAFAHLTNGIAEYALLGTNTDGLTNEITFSLPIPLTEEGEWSFSSPKSGYTVNGAATGFSAKYIIDANARAFDKTMVVEPAEGVVESLEKIYISFPKETTGWIGQEGGSITLTKDGEAIEIDSKYYDEEKKAFLLDLGKAYTEVGEYVLAIADNTFFVTVEWDENEEPIGFTNKAATFKFQIVDAETLFTRPAIDPSEDADLNSVTNFTLTLAEGETLETVKSEAVSLYKMNGDARGNAVATFLPSKGEGNTIVLTNMAGTEVELPAGSYELVIPAGLFSGENKTSAEYVYTFVSTLSVDELFGDDAPATVYNAAGIVVMKNATAADLKGLDRGLYIFKGKKIIVK